MKNAFRIGIIILTIAILTSCSANGKLLKGHDFDAQFKAAMKCYNEKNYSGAIQLYENLIMHYHGRENAEDISWYYGMSLMQIKDYYSAGYQFKNFNKRFPYSERAEESLFLAAKCKYLQSPEYYLDQKLTKEVIQEFESYVDRYPTSIHIPEINTCLDELQEKLMHKEYDIAYGYYLTSNYHAAYVSMQSFLNNYPNSSYREDAMFYMLSSGYEYGINSTDEKMRERLQLVINDFDRFTTLFSNSKYISEAQRIYTKTREALAALETRTAANPVSSQK